LRRSAAALVSLCVWAPAFALAVGCEAILGLGGETPLPDGGPDVKGDARVDARDDAGRPPGAALVVASNHFASDWCAVTVGGDVECWGGNDNGELGDGTTRASATPVKVKGLGAPAAYVSMGVVTVCALTRKGGVYCWGQGSAGELGNGAKTTLSTSAVRVSGLESGVTALSAGDLTACAVKDGAVWCWGSTGLLGTGQASAAVVPVQVPGLESGVTSVSVGDFTACAVKNGGLMCWGGFDGSGGLGNNTLKGSLTPVPVPTLARGVADVSVGYNFACALTTGGGVLCWGYGAAGELGNGQLAGSPVPVQVQGLTSGVSAVSAGTASATAIQIDGSVVTWGYAADGELGNGSAEADSGAGDGLGGASAVPVKVKGLSARAISVSTGQAPCVATTTGSVECWGITAESALTPVPVTALSHIVSITTGGNLSTGAFACATSNNGTVSCWGGNGAGQLGSGTSVSSNAPVTNELSGGTTVVSGATGGNFACADAFGAAYCWGDNSSGQLGNGTKVSSLDPVGVIGLTSGVTAVAAGGASACAISTAGTDAGAGGALYCWGDNTSGQLGNNSTTSSLVPMPVMGLGSKVTAVSLGLLSGCALLGDGTVECWGDNAAGELGDGTLTKRLAPVKVVGITGATAIAVSWYNACAVTSGAIQCWGGNGTGTLGDNSSAPSMVPVNVFGISSGASQVSVGPLSACAVVAGGAQCWGFGALGNNSSPALVFDYPAPVTGLDHGVTEVAVGELAACALVQGKVRCWGLNTAGQLGNGGVVDAFVPTPVKGFPPP